MDLDILWPAVRGPLWLALLAPCLLEGLMVPRPAWPWRRPAAALALYAGLWLLCFAALLALVQRPWFAAALCAALALLLTLVNNTKARALREAFVCQDFEYFIDMLRHPRLYIPFFGVGRALAGVALFLALVAAGWLLESPLSARAPSSWQERWLACAGLALLAALLLWLGTRARLALAFDPNADMRRLGFYAALWGYGLAERRPPEGGWPATRFAAPLPRPGGAAQDLPHIVAVQSESFFDARRLYPGVRSGLLPEFDRLRAQALASGRLSVPSWGANTVRTEFAFLSGLSADALGVHRFNPYRKLARQGIVTLASALRARGYRTVCVHPYPASFYLRDRNYPLMGFDAFVDIAGFEGLQGRDNAGPYVADAAVARHVAQSLEAARGGQPLFVYVLTMENHGPLHLETVTAQDEAEAYETPPPEGCRDLTAYLRHLRNADRMLGILRESLQDQDRAGLLCFYGDHVPIMPQVYRALGEPDGRTDYLLWHSARTAGQADSGRDIAASELAGLLVDAALPDAVAPGLTPPLPDDGAPRIVYPMPGQGAGATQDMLALVASGRRMLFGSGERRRRLLAGCIDAGRVIVACRDGRPLGFLSFQARGRGPFDLCYARFRQEFGVCEGVVRWLAYRILQRRERRYGFYVYSIRVLPEARRLGVGALLLDEALRQARLLGEAAVDAEIFCTNTGSQAFFAARGFAPVRRYGLRRLGRYAPAPAVVWVRRKLDDQASR